MSAHQYDPAYCTAERCVNVGVPQIQRHHSPLRCPVAPPKVCGGCGRTMDEER